MGQKLALQLSRSKQAGLPGFSSSCLMRAFSGPKTRPAAVAEQTGRLTWIFFVMFDERRVILYKGNLLWKPPHQIAPGKRYHLLSH